MGTREVVAKKCDEHGARLWGCCRHRRRNVVLIGGDSLDGLMIGSIVKDLEAMFVDGFLSNCSVDFSESISLVIELLVNDVGA